MSAIERLNAWADSWLRVMLLSSIEAMVLFVAIFVVWLPLRKWMPADLAYGLFLLALLKLITPIPIDVSGWPLLKGSPAEAVAQVFRWGENGESEREILNPSSVSSSFGPLTDEPAFDSAIATESVDVSSSPSVVSRSNRVNASVWLMVGWAMAATSMLAGLVVRYLAMHRRVSRAKPLTSDDLGIDLVALARKAGARGEIRFLEAPWLNSPAV